MQVRRWRNQKGWKLSLIWYEKQGGILELYNPHTNSVSTLRRYAYWEGHMAVNTAELVAAFAQAKELVVPDAA